MALKLPTSSVKALGSYTYKLSGIAYHPMGSYLAGIGLMRIINRHVDAEAKFYWQGTDFWIITNTPQLELVEKILANYEAIVIFSPWNNSSGIKVNKTGELAYEDSIEKIINSQSWRTKAIKELLPEFWQLIDEYKVGETTFERPKEQEKLKFINQCLKRITHPEWREWADATVILTEDLSKQKSKSIEAYYPPLLGSGGNVASVDIAVNYYKAVCTLFNLETGEHNTNAYACLTQVIFGIANDETTESDEVKAIHLFPTQDFKLDFKLSQSSDYAASGGSSASTVNPAWVLLASEGLSIFSSSISTINGSSDDSGKAIGRTLAKYSLAVATKGASTDLISLDERKSFTEEYFLPLWTEPRTYANLKARLFESPLASEEQFYLPRQIDDGTDFIQAIQSWAIQNNITGKFARYAMLPRKGQSNFAVLLELVEVGIDAKKLDLASDLDKYRRSLRLWARSEDCPTIVQGLIYQFERIFNQFIQGKVSHTELLMALGKLAPIRQPKSLRFEWLEPLLNESNSPEFRLALSIASCGLGLHLKENRDIFVVGNVIQSLVNLQRQWGLKAGDGQECYAPFKDINAFIIGENSFDDSQFERWLWGLSLINFDVKTNQLPEFEDIEVAFLKLPPAYRLGLIYIEKFSHKNLPIDAIAHGGDLKFIISRLMGQGINLRAVFNSQSSVNNFRCAAALAFPISPENKKKIFQRFFTQMSTEISTPADLSEMVNNTG